MKTKKQRRKVATFLVIILALFMPLVAAAPVGTSENETVETAKSWIGVQEIHGGNDRSGIDCSHLVYQVYKQVGVKNIVFQTVPNMKKSKYYVNTAYPRPGDIIFWEKDVTKDNKTYWLATHVGIYIGNGQFIHTNNKVVVDNMSGIYNDGMPYYLRWNTNNEELIKSKGVYIQFWEKYTHYLVTHEQTKGLLVLITKYTITFSLILSFVFWYILL